MANLMMIALVALVLLCVPRFAQAGELSAIQLPAPKMEGGKPLMDALKQRESTRSFSPRKLPLQTISDLLWAAFGINRPDSGRRTAPSARNWQETDIYVVMAEGVYRYDAGKNMLLPVVNGDLRQLTGMQPFVKDAPLNLVYVADTAKITSGTQAEKEFYAAADTGFIAQNAYLFCASEGLATVVRGLIDREALGKALKLGTEQRITLAQSVGYPLK